MDGSTPPRASLSVGMVKTAVFRFKAPIVVLRLANVEKLGQFTWNSSYLGAMILRGLWLFATRQK